jgi:hypothetical protein
MNTISSSPVLPRVNHITRRFYFMALVATAACGLTLSSYGLVLVDDHWADATRTDPASPNYADNNGSTAIDRDSDTELESAWFSTGTGASAPVTAGHMTLTMGSSSASWESYFTPEATPVTLTSAGDQLKITWVFTPNGVNTANTSQFFRLAVVDSPSATRVTTDAAPGSGAFTGYSMFMNMGQTLGNSNPFQLMKRNVASGDLLGTSGNWAGVTNGATSGNHGYDSLTQYTFEMSFTLMSVSPTSTNLQISATMSGGTLNGAGSATVTYTDLAPTSLKYDTFALRPSSAAATASTFDTTNFKVELLNVPEPSTMMLVGVGLAGLIAVRRRR